MAKAAINRTHLEQILHLIDPTLDPDQVQKVTIEPHEITVDLAPTLNENGDELRVRQHYPVSSRQAQ